MSSQRDKLRINREERRFLGVCAGIADYLDMPVLLVRIIFVISIFTWPTLLIAYLCIYFCLDRNITTDSIYDFLNNNKSSEHFRNLDYHRPIFRNMRNKRIAGVCSGLADYLEVRPVTVRALAILALFIMGPYAILAYGVGWFMMEPNPAPRFNSKQHRSSRRAKRRMRKHHRFSASRINDPGDGSMDHLYDPDGKPREPGYDPADTSYDKAEMHNSGKADKQQDVDDKSLEDCADVFYTLESRMRELEAFMTSKKFRLHCEINRI